MGVLDVDRVLKKLGANGAAKAFVDAKDKMEAANKKRTEADKIPPMTAKQWKANWDMDDEALLDAELPFDFEEGEEELLLEDGEEEEEVAEEEPPQEKPSAKKAKLA